MPASPRLNFRLSQQLADKLEREAMRRKKTASEVARDLIAEGLDFKGDSAVPKPGRPKLPAKSKNV